jgi:hypothetical protein
MKEFKYPLSFSSSIVLGHVKYKKVVILKENENRKEISRTSKNRLILNGKTFRFYLPLLVHVYLI